MQSNHDPMTGYLKLMLSVALALCLVPYTTLAFLGDNINIPPPRISDSISLNEKSLWLRKHLPNGCDILAIGSSITLNNVSSPVISRRLPEKSFINASSWGMAIRQTATLLKLIENYCRPELVIIVSAPVDFQMRGRPDENYSADLLRCLLDRCPLFEAHARGFALEYYLDNIFNIAKQRQRRDIYDSLSFDSGGGVPFAVSGFKIDRKRWENARLLAPAEMDERNYVALAGLAAGLQDKGVRLLLVQSPVRSELANETIRHSLSIHWQRMADIAAGTGALFLNLGLDPRFDDGDFVDAGHLNATGAELFTNLMIDAIES